MAKSLDADAIIDAVLSHGPSPRLMPLPRRAAAFLAAGLIAVLANAGCDRGSSDRGTVEVDIRVSVCLKGGGGCFGLALPDADVTVTASGLLLASGKTDQAGTAAFEIHDFGHLDVTVRSPLIEGGEKTGSTDLSPGGGSSLSLMAAMSPDAETTKP